MNYIKFTILLFAIAIAGCSSSQSTMYKPGDGGTGWKINVTKKASLGDEFVCTINDSVVISESFPLFGDNMEKSGRYRGKKVMMNGFRKTNTSTDSNGKITTSDTFQIRVFIEDAFVDKFDF
ncbi:MAG: hypothetical protein ABIY50_11940 [Ignavibacteria bacterium]